MKEKTFEFRGQGNERLRIYQRGRDWPILQEFDREKGGWYKSEVRAFMFAIFEELCRITDMNPKKPY